MPDTLQQEIRKFNQDVMKHELECIIFIRKELSQFLQRLELDSNDLAYQKIFERIDDNLKALLNTNNQETFELARKRFTKLLNELNNLRPEPIESTSFKNENSIEKVSDYLNELSETRASYLNKANDKKKLFLDAGWMGAGVGLIVVASILAIAFPWLLIPGIVLGGIVLGYGTFDFSKTASELYMETEYPKLGERTIGKDTPSLELERDMEGFSFSSLITEHQHQEEKKHQEKRFYSRLVTGLSFTGFLLAFASLAVVLIPALAIPVVGVVLLAAASIVTAIAAVTTLGLAHNKEKQALKESKLMLEKETHIDEMQILEVGQSLIPADNAAILLKKQSEEHFTEGGPSIRNVESSSFLSDLSEVSNPTDEVESESEGETDSDVETVITEEEISDRGEEESDDEDGDTSKASLRG
ncbi:hypothetical protein [Legionella impletisoli]|uniref:IncA protein n=1 Tax=Legionella impletisoli TaxID=343510 RepID=A0A917N7U8_9GAMM|nr:hypothetical protein [Legionella impletisoli]GGI76035.1 hypothetical protein GCM10007966_01150 [Legionella impletisoli]